jgi:peptidyl-prolyl cis-trans isomerase B (cyclophilin B)
MPFGARFISLLLLLNGACSGPAITAPPSSSPTATRTPVRLGPTATAPHLEPAPTQPGFPTPAPLPPVTDADRIRGPKDAAVTLVVYCDYQTPGCVQLAPILDKLRQWHPQDLRIVHRLFPLIDVHDKSSLAAQAALAAEQQDAFWRMHDALYREFESWFPMDPPAFDNWLLDLASELDLDQGSFQTALEEGQFKDEIQSIYQETVAAGISVSPFVFLNGEWFRTPLNIVNLEMAVRLDLLAEKQFQNYPPITIDLEREYYARIKLSIGELLIQLYPLSAPMAVNSFIFLAQEGWYDGVAIYKVIPERYVETGDPTETGLGDPGYHFADEIDPSRRFDEAGVLTTASSGPNTNGSRFLITLGAIPEWNGARTIFGKVVQGLDLLKQLEARDPFEDFLQPVPATIQSIEIEAR